VTSRAVAEPNCRAAATLTIAPATTVTDARPLPLCTGIWLESILGGAVIGCGEVGSDDGGDLRLEGVTTGKAGVLRGPLGCCRTASHGGVHFFLPCRYWWCLQMRETLMAIAQHWSDIG
jgi:hypothetical protein